MPSTPSSDFIIQDGMLLSYTGTASEVVVPEGVTSIAALAFEGNKNMETLRLSATVESVNKDALADCISLNQVVLSKDLSYFDQLSGADLEKVTFVIPEDMTEFNWLTFYNRPVKFFEVSENHPTLSSVDSVIFSKSMDEIIFYPSGKEGEEYTVPASVKKIGNSAFSCNQQIRSVLFEGAIEEVEIQAFWNCSKLECATFSKGITKIPYGMFVGCGSLREVSGLDGVTEIAEVAFSECANLTAITLPDTLKTIGKWAFRCCYSLETLNFPKSLESIGEEAFLDCTKLDSHPVGVADIGKDAFVNTRYLNKQKDTFGLDGTVVVDYNGPAGKVVFPEGVTRAQFGAFNKIPITSLTIPATFNDRSRGFGDRPYYEEVRKGVYSASTHLTYLNDQPALIATGETFNEIIVAEGNPYYKVVDGVLYTEDLSVLLLYPQGKKDKEFIIPDSVQVIGACAFMNCKNLESIYIPDSVKRIDGSTFHNCTSLTEVRMPEDVSYWGETFSNTPFAELNDIDTDEY